MLRSVLLLAMLQCFMGFAAAQEGRVASVPLDPHSTPEWAIVAPHLPDPASSTTSATELEQAGDVLRARRFPADAAVFYRAALNRGGHPDVLLKKVGVLYLEMQQTQIARATFQHAIKANKTDAESWNDLGATDFTLGNTRTAVGEYKKAIKLKKTSAVFRANLALAYFELKQPDAARSELAKALKIDPAILQHTYHGGYNMQLLSSAHYAEMCFEMARMAAQQGDTDGVLQWLTKASERGMDVRKKMQEDGQMKGYLRDPQVLVMLGNTEQLHTATVAKVKPPSLGEAAKP